jgi:hypothetical protein
MPRDFTDDDRGKRITAADGTWIGTVDEVYDGRATVERNEDADLTDKVKKMLGWDDDENENEIRSEDVDSYDDDEIRMRQTP